MPCGWGCGEYMTARDARSHFVNCENRPLTRVSYHHQRVLVVTVPDAIYDRCRPMLQDGRTLDWIICMCIDHALPHVRCEPGPRTVSMKIDKFGKE